MFFAIYAPMSLARALSLGLLLTLPACRDSSGPADGGVRERWYHVQPGWAWARPAVAGSTVYFGTGNGQVIARDVSTGIPRWATIVGQGPVNGANILVRGGVVVAPVVNFTVGLDALTGTLLWRYDSPLDTTGRGGSGGSPGVVMRITIDGDEQTVYVGAWGASISAIDLQTGLAQWVWTPGYIEGDSAASGVFRSGAGGVRISGDTLFATMWHYVNDAGVVSEGWLIALERSSGRELWRVKLPHQGAGVFMNGAPVVYRNLIILHTGFARTYAIDRTTLEIVWQTSPPLQPLTPGSQAELYDDVAYVDGGDSYIYALRASDGGVIWKTPIPGQTTTDMLLTPRRLIFTNGGTLYVLDRRTGAPIAETSQPRTHDPLFSSPAAYANGLVFVTIAEAAWCFEEP